MVKPIRDNISLLVAHLSGNPGLNYEVEEKFLRRLQATYEPQFNLESF